MAKKRSWVVFFGFTLVMLTTLFVSCSSFPVLKLKNGKSISYSMLGYIGASFETYDAAFTAARQKYPNADGVILVQGSATNDLIPTRIAMGYYAIKFTEITEAAPKKFLGIF